MCQGVTRDILVPIAADLSHTGVRRWALKPVDKCIARLVEALNAAGCFTRTSCCGHGRADGSILLEDGSQIVVPRTYLVPSAFFGGGPAEVRVTRGLYPADPSDD